MALILDGAPRFLESQVYNVSGGMLSLLIIAVLIISAHIVIWYVMYGRRPTCSKLRNAVPDTDSHAQTICLQSFFNVLRQRMATSRFNLARHAVRYILASLA